MKEVFATTANLAERVATRPASYLQDLRPAITRYVEGGIWVDVEHPAYAALAERYRANWGAPLWAALHAKAGATPEWLAAFTAAIPCDECREHFAAICRATPPDFGALWFAWTVHAHNEVNRGLGRRRWTIREARRLYPRGTKDGD